MNLYYNDIDILQNKDVHLLSCIATDCIGGEADSLQMAFHDYSALWNVWNPQLGDVIKAKKDGWTTGKMYIDSITDTDTSFILNARSLPPKSRSAKYIVWENVRFSKIASDLANLSGLELKTYDVTDNEYVRYECNNESPIKALNQLCMLESYCLKITNGQAIIYNEKTFEHMAAVVEIYPKKYNYELSDIGRSQVDIRWFNGDDLIIGGYSDNTINTESETITNLPIYNVAQAQRWCKGILRQYNKNRSTASIIVDQNLNLAAANVIATPKGNYFISKIQHNLIGSTTRLWLRKPIEGDY